MFCYFLHTMHIRAITLWGAIRKEAINQSTKNVGKDDKKDDDCY